jgi:Cys-tRNA(Pro)/Cys-tRNA(Cys) deacylase
MNEYEEKIKKIIKDNGVEAEHLLFKESTHSVEEAAKAVGADPEDFVKSICMVNSEGRLIVAIVKGEDRVSTSRVGNALGIERPRVASPSEVFTLTGFPCGGTPGFGFDAEFLMDLKVLEKEMVYLGGGSEYSLVKMKTEDLQRINGAKIVKIRK